MSQNTIYNNTLITLDEYNKISKGSTRITSPNPIGTTVLADNTHDGLSPLCLKSATVEDNMIEHTRIVSNNKRITTILSEYGKCIEYKNPMPKKGVFTPQNFTLDFNPETAPYDIPNNNKQCFIRDCFDGTWVPGLNNIFDQAGASLKSFIEYHNDRNGWKLDNPIKRFTNNTAVGGINQQLRSFNQNAAEYLKYTAYFNYDLLLFKFITEQKNPIPSPDTNVLLTKVNNAINNIPPNDLLTPNDIFVINTVNINFIWCKLMIYCYICITNDGFFQSNNSYKTGYVEILKKLTQIRFDSFATTQDGYISNPYIYYRGSTTTNILKIIDGFDFLKYVEGMCTDIYKGSGIGGIVMETRILSGGVEYVTSQSMAATCMSQFLQLIFPGRSKKTGDVTKIACMNEINKLFNLTKNKKYAGYGWSLLKFSGDSSHIVFGDVMEDIKKEYAIVDLDIIYAISERPLAARLLAAEKNVYSAVQNIFSKNFNGPGSENNSLRHAALYIQWDKAKVFANIMQGLVDKYNENVDKLDSFEPRNVTDSIEQFDMIRSIILDENTEYPILDDMVNSRDNKTIEDYLEFTTVLLQYESVKQFLKNYSIKKLEEKLQNIPNLNNNLASLLPLFGGRRGAGHTNWLKIMKAFNTNTNSDEVIRAAFNTMYEVINLLVNYYIDEGQTNNGYFTTIFSSENFNKIFQKIIKAHLNTIRGGINYIKIADFKQSREEEWRSDSKGDGDIIPGKVDSIIIRMETLLLNCFKIYEIITTIMQGGGNGGSGNVGSAKKGVNRTQVRQGREDKQNIQRQIQKTANLYGRRGILTDEQKEKEAIETKEFVINLLTNGQFVNVNDDESENIESTVQTSKMDEDKMDEEEEEELTNKDNEFESLYDSLTPFLPDSTDVDTDVDTDVESEYNISKNSSMSNLTLDKIFMNRLKNLDISDPRDFNTLYDNEKDNIQAAIDFIYEKEIKVKGILQKEFIDIQIPAIQQIVSEPSLPDFNTIDLNVAIKDFLTDLSDIKMDNNIHFDKPLTITPGAEYSLSYYFNPSITGVDSIRKTIYKTLIEFFPNLDTIVPLNNNQYQSSDVFNILYTMEQLSRVDGHTLSKIINTKTPYPTREEYILETLENRAYIARLISTLGPMEPFSQARTDVTRITRWKRFLNKIHILSTGTTGNQHLQTTIQNYVYIGPSRGGKKTHKKRKTLKKTKRTKKIRYVTKSSHRKKTKNANRSKKNNTRRKRHY